MLAERCPNLIGFKDGIGDIESFVSIRRQLGERFAYLGGLPTAELFAGAYQAMGCPVYSSAVFNFIPRTAVEFYKAHAAGDTATTNRLLDTFFLPYIELRNRGQGYAVSIVKAGATTRRPRRGAGAAAAVGPQAGRGRPTARTDRAARRAVTAEPR